MFHLVIFFLIGASTGDKLSNGAGYSRSVFNGATRDTSSFPSVFGQSSQDVNSAFEGLQNSFDTSAFGGNFANGFESAETGFEQDSAEFQRSQFLNRFESANHLYAVPLQQNGASSKGNGKQQGYSNGNNRQNGVNGNGIQIGISARGNGRHNGYAINSNGRENGINGNSIQNGISARENGRHNVYSINGNGRQNGVNGNGIMNGISAKGNGKNNVDYVNGNGIQNGVNANGNGAQNGVKGIDNISQNGYSGKDNDRPQESNGFRMMYNGGSIAARAPKGKDRLSDGSYGAKSMDSEVPACQNGEVMDPNGDCVEPEVIRNLYVYKQPEMETNGYEMPLDLPKPKVKLNVVVINSASEETSEPIIIPPPQEKTLVLVLKKDDDEQKVIEIPENPPSQPEVYFVEYNEGENPELPGGIDLQTALQSSVSQDDDSPEVGIAYSAPSSDQQPQNGFTQMRSLFSSQNGNGQFNSQYLPPQPKESSQYLPPQSQQQPSNEPDSQYSFPPSEQPFQNGNQGEASYVNQSDEEQPIWYGMRQMAHSQQNGGYPKPQQASVMKATLSAFIPDSSNSNEGRESKYMMHQQSSVNENNGSNGYSGVPAPQAPSQRQMFFY